MILHVQKKLTHITKKLLRNGYKQLSDRLTKEQGQVISFFPRLALVVDVQIRATYPQSQCFPSSSVPFDFEMLVLDLEVTDVEEEEEVMGEEGQNH